MRATGRPSTAIAAATPVAGFGMMIAGLAAAPALAQAPPIPGLPSPAPAGPAASGFGALGTVGAQQPPGSAQPAFPLRTTGDDPGFENGALNVIGAVAGKLYATAGLNAIYDDNILRLGSTAAVRPGQSRDDLRLTPQLEVGTNLPFGRQTFFASGFFGRDYYINNTRLDRNRYRLGGGINWRLGARCAGTADASFNSQQSLLAELSELVPNAQETLSYGFAGQCRAFGGLSVGATVRRLETSNSNPTRTPFDNRSLSYGPQISYGLATLGTFSISATWNDAEYPNRRVLLPTGTQGLDGVQIFQGRFGYARQFGPRLGVVAGIDIYRNEPKPGTIVVNTGLVDANDNPIFALQRRRGNTTVGFDTAVSYDSGSRLTAQLSASLRNNLSLNVGARSQKRQQYGLDLAYKLGRAIVVGSSLGYVITDYQGSFATPDEPFARTRDKLFRVVGSIDYTPVKLYSIGLEVGYQRRDANPAIYSYDSTSVRLRLRVNYGRSG